MEIGVLPKDMEKGRGSPQRYGWVFYKYGGVFHKEMEGVLPFEGGSF